MSFMDEFLFYSIHEDEYKKANPVVKAFLSTHEFAWYPNGLKDGKPVDKVAEFKRLSEQLAEMHKIPGESNSEGLIVDQMVELFRRMDLQEIRKLSIKVKE